MATFDSVLSWLIPVLLVVVVIGFLWTKVFEPWVMPLVRKIIAYFKGKEHEEEHMPKEIAYEY